MTINICCLCIGGALGALLRAFIAERLDNTQSGFPFGTFVANMLASFLLGVIISVFNHVGDIPTYAELLLETGFCATLSTFSSLAWQIANMLKHRHFLLATVYAISTSVCGMFLFFGAISL